jgi:hypothetical protein
MTEAATTARAMLAELAERMKVSEQYQRFDSDGLAFVAGFHGIIRPGPGGLLVILRKDAPALVDKLIGNGLIAVSSTGDMTLARLPTPPEYGQLRELVGVKQNAA